MGRRISHHGFDDGTDRWSVAEARAHAALADAVERYSWWSESTRSFTVRHELAATAGVFIVNLGAPLEILDARGDWHRLAMGEGFVGGMAQATSLSRSTGAMEGVHVHMPTPDLARAMNVPLAAIFDRVVRFEDLVGGAARELGGRLVEAGTVEERFALLDAFLAQRLNDAAPADRATAHVLAQLKRGHRVQPIADALGWSRKRLAHRFRDSTGMEPRAFAGLARFERFAAMLQAGPEEPLAEIAVAAGYADQAHLTRETARYAAMTPGALRARLLPARGGVRG